MLGPEPYRYPNKLYHRSGTGERAKRRILLYAKWRGQICEMQKKKSSPVVAYATGLLSVVLSHNNRFRPILLFWPKVCPVQRED